MIGREMLKMEKEERRVRKGERRLREWEWGKEKGEFWSRKSVCEYSFTGSREISLLKTCQESKIPDFSEVPRNILYSKIPEIIYSLKSPKNCLVFFNRNFKQGMNVIRKLSRGGESSCGQVVTSSSLTTMSNLTGSPLDSPGSSIASTSDLSLATRTTMSGQGSSASFLGNCRICRKMLDSGEKYHFCNSCSGTVCEDCSSYLTQSGKVRLLILLFSSLHPHHFSKTILKSFLRIFSNSLLEYDLGIFSNRIGEYSEVPGLSTTRVLQRVGKNFSTKVQVWSSMETQKYSR